VWPCRCQCYGVIKAATIIVSRDAVEEFLACGLWPLSEKFGFSVETKETPLTKVVVLMPQVTSVGHKSRCQLLRHE
jgi:hypothetical protein